MPRGKETQEERFRRKIAEESKVLAECLPGWNKDIKYVVGVTNPITELKIRVVQLAMEEHIAWKVMNCLKTALQELPREPIIHPCLAGNILFNLNAVFKISYKRGPWFVIVGTNFNIAIALTCTEFMQAAVGGDLRILVYNIPYPKNGVSSAAPTPSKSPASNTAATAKTKAPTAKSPKVERTNKSPMRGKSPVQAKSAKSKKAKSAKSKKVKSHAKSPKGKTAKSPTPQHPPKK